MLIILIILFLLLGGFGTHLGYKRYGSTGGIGCGGILLIILIIWLVIGMTGGPRSFR